MFILDMNQKFGKQQIMASNGLICYEHHTDDQTIDIRMASVDIDKNQLFERNLKLKQCELNVIIVIDNEDGAFSGCFDEFK